MEVLEVGHGESGVLDARQGAAVGVGEEPVVDRLVRPGVLPAELLGLGADGVDHRGGEGAGEGEPRDLQVLGEDRGGGPVVRPDVGERDLLLLVALRVVVEHQLGHHPVGELAVAGEGLGVHQGEAPVELEVQMPQVGELRAQDLEELPVLRPTHDPGVGQGHLLLEAVAEDPPQDRRRGDGVRVRVVVGEDQPPPVAVRATDQLGELAVALARALPGGHGVRFYRLRRDAHPAGPGRRKMGTEGRLRCA